MYEKFYINHHHLAAEQVAVELKISEKEALATVRFVESIINESQPDDEIERVKQLVTKVVEMHKDGHLDTKAIFATAKQKGGF